MSLSPSSHAAQRSLVPSPRRGLADLTRSARHLGRRRPTDTLLVDLSGVIAFPTRAAALGVRFSSFESWCASNQGRQVLIVLSAHLVHSLPLAVGTRAGSRHDEAKRTFTQYFGKPAEAWSVASATAAGASFGCALHGFDLARAVDDAAAQGVTPVAALPLWACALPAACARAPALQGAEFATLILVERTLVTCMELQTGRLVALQQRRLRSPSAAGLADLLDRQQAETGRGPGLTFVTGWGGEQDGDIGDGAAWHSLGNWQGVPEGAGWLLGVEESLP